LEILMRNLFAGFLTALFLTAMATPADARGSGYATAQELLFVSTTEFTNDDGPLALCHLVKTHSVLFINVWRTLEGYAIADNSCLTDMYFDMTSAELEAGKATGMIPASVPSQPKLSLTQMAEGAWGLGALALLLAFAGFKALQVSQRRKQRMSIVSGATSEAQAILDAMCHAAKADGYVAPSEVDMIKRAAEEMTGQSFQQDVVKRMADLAEEKLDLKGFKRLINGQSRHAQLDMMRAVLMVVAADGKLDGKEKVFVGGLAQAMKMDGGTVADLLAEVMGQQAAVPAL
jgi:uncharacterized membrane protein YebE (DUF533 family)